MSYPKLSELKNTRVLQKDDLKLHTSICIVGGFLERPFHEAIEHYFKNIGIYPEIVHDNWKPLWRSLHFPYTFENIRKSEVIIVPITPYEIIDSIKDGRGVVDALEELLNKINSFKNKTIFYLIDRRSILGVSISSPNNGYYKKFISLINELEQSENRNDRYVIPVYNFSSQKRNSLYSDWVSYGFPFSLDNQARCSKIIAATCAYKNGLGKKLIAIDYDETLSPGIIGEKTEQDDFLLDLANPRDRYYAEFQVYIKSLLNKGFILALISKNEPQVEKYLLSGEGHHLKREDFVSINLSWESKSKTLKEICAQLKIGSSESIFIDNSNIECQEISISMNEVENICLGPDPSLYIENCQDNIWLNSLYEDPESERRFKSYESKLLDKKTGQPKGLTGGDVIIPIEVEIKKLQEKDISRSIQLINKTNQFNLSGEKISLANLDDFDLKYVSYMKDEYCEYGLTSVLLAIKEGRTIHITQWVVSCRTFSRGYENKILEQIALQCSLKEFDNINIRYKQTPRNGYLFRYIDSEEFKVAQENLRKMGLNLTKVCSL